MAQRSKVRAKQAALSRVSMVAPVPAKPAAPLHLEDILKLLGNDRAYTVIITKPNSFKVHFEGDYKVSTIKLVNGKPVITKEDD
jgi:hypothetical protein